MIDWEHTPYEDILLVKKWQYVEYNKNWIKAKHMNGKTYKLTITEIKEI